MTKINPYRAENHIPEVRKHDKCIQEYLGCRGKIRGCTASYFFILHELHVANLIQMLRLAKSSYN